MKKEITKIMIAAIISATFIIVPYWVHIGIQDLFIRQEDYIQDIPLIWFVGVLECLVLGVIIAFAYLVSDEIIKKT